MNKLNKSQTESAQIKPLITVLLSLYHGESYLEGYLNNYLAQSWCSKAELVIIHNDANEKELEILKKYQHRIDFIYLPRKREAMYASLNAGILASSGKYITIWNVDDIRTPRSLELLASSLEKNSLVGWAYGDFGLTIKYGGKVRRYIKSPEWSLIDGTSGSIGGPFFMFRRSLICKVGLFDEQFYSGGDFDYTVRLSFYVAGIRVNGLLGYFLNERRGLSTAGNLQAVERTVIQIRYGIWSGFDLNMLNNAFKYKVNLVLNNGNWIHLQIPSPGLNFFLNSRSFKLKNAFLYTAREYIRRSVKSIFVKISSFI